MSSCHYRVSSTFISRTKNSSHRYVKLSLPCLVHLHITHKELVSQVCQVVITVSHPPSYHAQRTHLTGMSSCHPPSHDSVKVNDRFFHYALSFLWNEVPKELHQPAVISPYNCHLVLFTPVRYLLYHHLRHPSLLSFTRGSKLTFSINLPLSINPHWFHRFYYHFRT